MYKQVRRVLRIFTFLLVSLLGVRTVIAYHGSSGGGGGVSISPLSMLLIILGIMAGFGLLIWFLRKSAMNINKSK